MTKMRWRAIAWLAALIAAVSCTQQNNSSLNPTAAGFAVFDDGKATVKRIERQPMHVRYELEFEPDRFIQWLADCPAFYEMTGASDAEGEAEQMIRERLSEHGGFYIGGSDIRRESGLYTLSLYCNKINASVVEAFLEIQRFSEE